ncbi:hypothetical protein ACH5RR_037975 [Cinchona calisaya]|uniref:GDSL esterase/lipase n=1 Tax=Cinchona calisaya TaxID=153742 RepID=A0ABD2Y7R4_9GENT
MVSLRSSSIMGKTTIYAFISFFFFLFAFITSSEGQSVPAMYVFGDSLVDVGNNNYIKDSILKADYPYNGIDYPGGIPTGRFSNGKNAADFLAEKVGLPTSPPYLSNTSDVFLQGVSFASGGSGLFNSTGQGFLMKTLSLAKQVDYYAAVHERLVKQLGPDGAKLHLSKSLFLVVIGGNDALAYFELGIDKIFKKVSPDEYVGQMVNILQGLLKQIYNLGGRKFVVAGLTSIGCCPGQRIDSITEECKQDINALAINYNQQLTSMLAGLKLDFDDFNYSYFNSYTVLSDIIQNAATYGTILDLNHIELKNDVTNFELKTKKVHDHAIRSIEIIKRTGSIDVVMDSNLSRISHSASKRKKQLVVDSED